MRFLMRVREHTTERQAVILVIVVIVIVGVVFALVYPHANAHGLSSGTDRDDAADLGARSILHGHYPYNGRTYLGQAISQLPGALLLAAPFVALGKSAYAAFFWLPVFVVLLRSLAGEWRLPVLMLVLTLVAAPGLMREIVTGGDLVANGIYVSVVVWLLLRAERLLPLAVASLALGFALSSRLNFLFVLPPLIGAILRRDGARRAALAAVLQAISFAAVTLPFALHSGAFSPLSASNQLARFADVLPGGWATIGVVTAAIAIWVALATSEWTTRRVFSQAALWQVVLVLSVVVLQSARSTSIDFSPLVPGYGLLPLFFALAAIAGGDTEGGAIRRSLGGRLRADAPRREEPLAAPATVDASR
jgi:hypothetical protein